MDGRMKVALLIAVAFALLVASSLLQPTGCRRKPANGLPTVRMEMGGETFTLEVANTEAARQYGLMHRDSMPSDHGMLFVFAEERPQGFWMKNTRIPLDIVFLDASGKVVSIHQMKPYDLRSTRSDGPAQYAIEINEGRAAKAGVKPGDQLKIPEGVEAK
jgi:uncharacterized membrane protein (UPF0127 family)